MGTYDITQTFNLPTCSVDNGFMRWLYTNFTNSVLNYKLPMFVLNNTSNSDIVSQYPDVQNILTAPSIDLGPNLDVYTELTNERYKLHGGNIQELSRDMRETLLVDYLLKTCICYVEIFKGTIPTKFYATRNYDLLKFMSEADPEDQNYGCLAMPLTKDITAPKEEAKLKNLCTPLTLENIKKGTIKYIKLEKKKSGLYSITIPRTETSVPNTAMRITPVFFNFLIGEMLFSELQTKLLKISYLKDNLVERSVITSLNYDILMKAYENNSEKAHTAINFANKNNIARGYITVPELLLPENDETGCRAVSFRICKIEVLDPDTFTNPYLHIDLDGVKWSFEQFLQDYQNNIACLQMIYFAVEQEMGSLSTKKLLPQEEYNKLVTAKQQQISGMSADMIRANLESWLNTCMLIDKTQTSRRLHTLMVNNTMLFPRYTGKITKSSEIDWNA